MEIARANGKRVNGKNFIGNNFQNVSIPGHELDFGVFHPGGPRKKRTDTGVKQRSGKCGACPIHVGGVMGGQTGEAGGSAHQLRIQAVFPDQHELFRCQKSTAGISVSADAQTFRNLLIRPKVVSGMQQFLRRKVFLLQNMAEQISGLLHDSFF